MRLPQGHGEDLAQAAPAAFLSEGVRLQGLFCVHLQPGAGRCVWGVGEYTICFTLASDNI